MGNFNATQPVRSLREIAKECCDDWRGKISPSALPCLEAMLTIDKISDSYFADSAKSVVLYFLANANSWRGDVARRIKAELKGMVK